MTRILIADAHNVVRRGIRAIVAPEPDIRVVGESCDGHGTVREALSLEPDVIVSDYALPGMDGAEVARRLRRQLPRTEVLIFATDMRRDVLADIFEAGVKGYVARTESEASLIAGIRSLAIHRPYLSNANAEAVFDLYEVGCRRSDRSMLTRREREIVCLISNGETNRSVASLLGLSVKTVETHRTSAMRKLAISSTAGLVRYAVRSQLVVP